MTVDMELIQGFGFGLEYFDDEIFGKGFLVEFLFFRLLFTLADK